MANRKHERVSQRRYAEMLGVSNTAVANAVKDGRISKGWDKKNGKIIVALADEEWGDTTRKIPKEDAPATITGGQAGSEKTGKDLTDKTTKAEAVRIKEIENARIRILERQQMEGKLVEKEKVNNELFELGRVIRKKFDALPERIVDLVRAAPDRNAAILIVEKEKDTILESIVKGEKEE